jgi:hypothetical protein
MVDSSVILADATGCDAWLSPDLETAMIVAITRTDLSAVDLRQVAARTLNAKIARRMLAVALGHGVRPLHRVGDVEHHQHAMAASRAIAFVQQGGQYLETVLI